MKIISEEEYDELIDRKIYWDDISCSCHINPPCNKCINYPSDEELALMKQYEEEI